MQTDSNLFDIFRPAIASPILDRVVASKPTVVEQLRNARMARYDYLARIDVNRAIRAPLTAKAVTVFGVACMKAGLFLELGEFSGLLINIGNVTLEWSEDAKFKRPLTAAEREGLARYDHGMSCLQKLLMPEIEQAIAESVQPVSRLTPGMVVYLLSRSRPVQYASPALA